MSPSPERPSDLELQILGVLWQQSPLTARQVLDALPDGKQRAYTTVLTTMQIMEKKGLVTRRVDAVAHLWRPAVTRRQVMGPLMKVLVRNAFGGRPSAALQHLLQGDAVDADELAEIRRLLNDYEAKQNRSGADQNEEQS